MSLLEFPFSSASGRTYYSLKLDSDGRVIEKSELTFADKSLESLSRDIRILAVIPFSPSWKIAAAAFFAVFALCLLRILEIFPFARGKP